MKFSFQGRILIFGSGAVSRCLQSILLRHEGINYTNIVIVEPQPGAAQNAPLKKRGSTVLEMKITKENYASFLSQYLKAGDIIIDLAVNIDTGDIIEWCQQHGVLFINTSIEWWDPNEDIHTKDLIERTLYARHEALLKRAAKWGKNGHTAVVEHGANPGLVSHWTKAALEKIGAELLTKTKDAQKKESLEKALAESNFAQLAYQTGTKVIHVSERDTQIAVVPKCVNEFVNTWSVDGLHEEGLSPAEMSWGTHEKTLPQGGLYTSDLRNHICLNAIGINSFMYSWIPSGDIIGMLIRHGEAVSIGKHLTLMEDDQVLYSPTVHYVYLVSDSTVASLHELKMAGYQLQPKKRILYDEISTGCDELGVLLLGHHLNGWFEGSRLSIGQARQLVGEGNNATTLQVAASIFGALCWMIKNPRKGLCYPDDLPHKEVLGVANPYLGELLSVATDWNPVKNRINPLKSKEDQGPTNNDDPWQFKNFVFSIHSE